MKQPTAKQHVGWVGIDLDGTLAYYDGWKGPHHIGPPIERMVFFMKSLQSAGATVKIFTARASIATQIPPIRAWLKRYGFGDLEVTCTKDLGMIALYDDRAVQVVTNTGELMTEAETRELKAAERTGFDKAVDLLRRAGHSPAVVTALQRHRP